METEWMPCVDSSHSHLPCPAFPLAAVYPVLFHILRSTNFAQKIANSIHMSVTLNPRTYRRNMANPALLLLPAANLSFIFFSFSFDNFNVFPTFTRWFLEMFWGNVVPVVAIQIYAHRICQQLSSRKDEGRKEGCGYAYMDICTYVYLYLYPWLATVAVSANNLHFNLPTSFRFFFFVLHLLLPKKFNCQ